jgi:pilus assembly protein CpaD
MSVRSSHMLLKAALLGASAIALSACEHSAQDLAFATGEHREIRAQEVTAELKIDTVVAGEKLTPLERDAVKYFAAAYLEEGHGAVIISRPGNGADDIAAMRASADAKAIMLAEGVDSGSITEGPYDASGARSAPLVISYRTYEAVVPNCPDVSNYDFAWTGTNTALPSFGCAVNTSFAAMIADPSDLVGKQKMDPVDIARRGVVLSKYREGAASTTERSSQNSGAISGAVQ